MYLHIGRDTIVKAKDIIGIFDLESIKKNRENNNMLNELIEKNDIVNISDNIKKTLVLIEKDKKVKAYISNISSATLNKKRNLY